MRRFELHRDEDVSGVSGIGVVAEGVAFSDGGPVALRWTSEYPTSVVFHDRGVESLEAIHGHNGRTRIVWLDDEEGHEMSTWAIDGEALTWKALHATEQQRCWDLNDWKVLVSDLDRCEHGRHQVDACSSCGGPSVGNLLLPAGTVLGHTMDARPIVQPDRQDRGRIEAWRP